MLQYEKCLIQQLVILYYATIELKVISSIIVPFMGSDVALDAFTIYSLPSALDTLLYCSFGKACNSKRAGINHLENCLVSESGTAGCKGS